MATFQANTQFSIDNFSLGFEPSEAETDFQDNVNVSFQGGSYQDFYSLTATDGSESRRFELYGTGITTTEFQGLTVPTGGTIQAVAEYSESAGTYDWFATGLSTSVSSAVNALLSTGTSDDIAIIENGLGGNDTITLSPFNDVMRGYNGSDRMTGGGGDDILDGGSGSDTAVFTTSFANATVTFEGSVLVIATPSEGTDRLTNFEFVDFNGDVRSVTSLLPPNDPPVPTAATASATEDGPVVGGQLVATDPQGDSLTFARTGADVAGLTINPGGSYTFNPAGSAYQSLAAGQTQTITATFSVSDGRDSAASTLTITVTGVNDAPIFQTSAQTLTTAANTGVTFMVAAIDVDDDTLTYTPSDPANGSITLAAGVYTYTPDTGYNGTDTFTVQASDGNGGTATQTFTVTVVSDNAPPEISAEGTFLSTAPGAAKAFTVTATDEDGDTLNYTASNPANGSVTGGTNGQFTYTPDAGFNGTDTVTITVSDGNGGTDTQVYTFSVGELIPSLNEFAVLASSGFSGSFGGYGNVFGTTNGVEIITVVDVPGAVRFDPSFNKGNDAIRLAGDAADWTIVRSSSAAILSDGDTFIQVPAGVAGMAIEFDDGVRLLRIDTAAGTLRIGSQAFGEDAVEIAAPAQSIDLPAVGDDDASAQLIMQTNGEVVAGGMLNVFGTTSGDETIELLFGEAGFDPSFNQGGDVLMLDGAAQSFTAERVGSNLLLTSTEITIEVPVGINGMAIEFTGGDERILRFDTEVSSFVLGDQQIGFDPIALAAA